MRSTIILDPGHGGSAPAGKSTPYGAQHTSGQHEKVINLELARRVMGALSGHDVRLTRTDDRNLSLGARAGMARAYGGDTRFVSLHSNWGYPSSLGTQTWVHTRAPGNSHQLASSIQGEIARLSGGPLGVQSADFAVLDPEALGHGAAACLVEAQLPTDRIGAPLVPASNELDAIARAIASGIQSMSYAGAPPLRGASAYGGVDIVIGTPGWRDALTSALAGGAAFSIIIGADRMARFYSNVVAEARRRGIDLLNFGVSDFGRLLALAEQAGPHVLSFVRDWLRAIVPAPFSSLLEAPGSYTEGQGFFALPPLVIIGIIAVVGYILLQIVRAVFDWLSDRETQEMHRAICLSGRSSSVNRGRTRTEGGRIDEHGNVQLDADSQLVLECPAR